MKSLVSLVLKIALICSLFSGCSPTLRGENINLEDVSAEAYEGFKTAEIADFLLLPVIVRSDSSGGVLVDPEKVLGLPDKNSTKSLVNAFEIHTELSLVDIPADQMNKIIPDNGLTHEGLFKIAGAVARQEKISNVIFAIIDNKDDRTGGGLGSERSSSIGYRIWVYNLGLDKVIWSSAYQSKQESLSSNLFEFGEKMDKGIGFKTTEELLKNAFRNSAIKLKNDIARRK